MCGSIKLSIFITQFEYNSIDFDILKYMIKEKKEKNDENETHRAWTRSEKCSLKHKIMAIVVYHHGTFSSS